MLMDSKLHTMVSNRVVLLTCQTLNINWNEMEKKKKKRKALLVSAECSSALSHFSPSGPGRVQHSKQMCELLSYSLTCPGRCPASLSKMSWILTCWSDKGKSSAFLQLLGGFWWIHSYAGATCVAAGWRREETVQGWALAIRRKLLWVEVALYI